jgi:catechol 2,3-dioxygenase-like lactoylglutathione lyase family enzyme
MFDHVKFGVSDFAASKAFFLKALEPLGVAVVAEGPPTYGVELCPKSKASLCLYQTEEKPAHLHLAFTAENRQQVEAFYRAALQAGGKDNGAPGLRPQYTRTTMQLSSLVRTGTTSKRFATNPRPDRLEVRLTCGLMQSLLVSGGRYPRPWMRDGSRRRFATNQQRQPRTRPR